MPSIAFHFITPFEYQLFCESSLIICFTLYNSFARNATVTYYVSKCQIWPKIVSSVDDVSNRDEGLALPDSKQLHVWYRQRVYTQS